MWIMVFSCVNKLSLILMIVATSSSKELKKNLYIIPFVYTEIEYTFSVHFNFTVMQLLKMFFS